MNTDKIILLSIGSFLLATLLCFCKIYCKKKQREKYEKINIKNINDILHRNKKIKPISDIEETKDERENNIRNADPTDIP